MASEGSWVDTYAGNANGATSNDNKTHEGTNANAVDTTISANVEDYCENLGYDGMRSAVRDGVPEIDQVDLGVNANRIDYSAV